MSVTEQPMAQKWVGTDVDISRLSHRARADALSIDGVYLADYSIALLTGGVILPLGPAIADCEPAPLRVCAVCGNGLDARLFLHDKREDRDGECKSYHGNLCRACLNNKARVKHYAKDQQVKRERRHELIADLLRQQPWYSNVKVAELATKGGAGKTGDALVGTIRKRLELAGELKPMSMRIGVDGLVHQCGYQSRVAQSLDSSQ